MQVAAQLESPASETLVRASTGAFVDASRPVYLAAGVIAVVGAIIAVRFLPSRDAELNPVIELKSTAIDGATPAVVPVRID